MSVHLIKKKEKPKLNKNNIQKPTKIIKKKKKNKKKKKEKKNHECILMKFNSYGCIER